MIDYIAHLDVLVEASDVLLLSQPVRDLFRAESTRIGGQLLHFDQSAGKLAILHDYRVLSHPCCQRRCQLAIFTVFPLGFLREQIRAPMKLFDRVDIVPVDHCLASFGTSLENRCWYNYWLGN